MVTRLINTKRRQLYALKRIWWNKDESTVYIDRFMYYTVYGLAVPTRERMERNRDTTTIILITISGLYKQFNLQVLSSLYSFRLMRYEQHAFTPL
jgi:hypothetical protein